MSGPEFIDEIYQDQLRFGFRVKRLLLDEQSSFQRIEVYETKSHGKVMLLDGCFMVSERDEAIYHEMMVHVPMRAHPQPRSVLIVGGGDGGTAREVLRYSNVETVDMVEIDERVLAAARQYFPRLSAAFTDPRLNLVVGDGVKFVACMQDRYDVILVDSTDPVGMAQPLFDAKFYGSVFEALRADGIVVAQGESPFYMLSVQKALLGFVANKFPIRTVYNFTNQTYPGGLWSFLWASKTIHPYKSLNPGTKFGIGEVEMEYYSSDVHKAAFSLPSFQYRALREWIRL